MILIISNMILIYKLIILDLESSSTYQKLIEVSIKIINKVK